MKTMIVRGTALFRNVLVAAAIVILVFGLNVCKSILYEFVPGVILDMAAYI